LSTIQSTTTGTSNPCQLSTIENSKGNLCALQFLALRFQNIVPGQRLATNTHLKSDVALLPGSSSAKCARRPVTDASATVTTMSHISDVSDAARARELYKCVHPSPLAEIADKRPRYFQPSIASLSTKKHQPFAEPAPPEDPGSFSELNVQSNVSSSKISSPDTALTAFCQLVSWRTGTQRAMIRSFTPYTKFHI
jgi:hypothetical protein